MMTPTSRIRSHLPITTRWSICQFSRASASFSPTCELKIKDKSLWSQSPSSWRGEKGESSISTFALRQQAFDPAEHDDQQRWIIAIKVNRSEGLAWENIGCWQFRLTSIDNANQRRSDLQVHVADEIPTRRQTTGFVMIMIIILVKLHVLFLLFSFSLCVSSILKSEILSTCGKVTKKSVNMMRKRSCIFDSADCIFFLRRRHDLFCRRIDWSSENF